jgi:hypothetical protein
MKNPRGEGHRLTTAELEVVNLEVYDMHKLFLYYIRRYIDREKNSFLL